MHEERPAFVLCADTLLILSEFVREDFRHPGVAKMLIQLRPTVLAPVIEEAGDLSEPLGEVWTDGLPASQGMDHDHRTVIHDDGYVSEERVHTNQAECL